MHANPRRAEADLQAAEQRALIAEMELESSASSTEHALRQHALIADAYKALKADLEATRGALRELVEWLDSETAWSLPVSIARCAAPVIRARLLTKEGS